MASPRKPHQLERTTEQWAENRAWHILQEVRAGRMPRDMAEELCKRVWDQIRSEPLPDTQSERLKRLLLPGSTF